jgi:folate-binding protein YgfZ
LHDFTDGTATVAVAGPAAQQVLTELGALPGNRPCSFVEWGHSQVGHCSYTGEEGCAVFVPSEEKQHLMDRLREAGVPEADRETFEAFRIMTGKPRFGCEITSSNIPQETAQMHAVHFSKGCYIGQEIVERVRSRGHVNRRITHLQVDGEAPPVGAKVMADGKEVGEILSSATLPGYEGAAAIALMRVEAIEAKTPLTAGGTAVRPSDLRAPKSE